jgi:hypothetical protein
MQKLHLVGFTADFDGLIFSARKGAKSGSFVVPLDGRLLKQIAEAQQRRDGGSAGPSRVEERLSSPRLVRPESALSPREMQDRIRSGWTLDEVAAEAGVDLDWVRRFAAPVLAEVRRVVERSRDAVYDKPRFGLSTLPLGASVRRNVLDRGVRLLDEELDDCWSAYQLDEDVWVVRFAYTSRGRSQEAEWLFDLETEELTSRNRLAAQLGHVVKGRRRASVPATSSVPKPTKQVRPAKPPVAKPVKAVKTVKAVKPVKKAAKTTTAAAKRASAPRPAKRPAGTKAAAKKAPAAPSTTARSTVAASAPPRTASSRPTPTTTPSTRDRSGAATSGGRPSATAAPRSSSTSRPVAAPPRPSTGSTGGRSPAGSSARSAAGAAGRAWAGGAPASGRTAPSSPSGSAAVAGSSSTATPGAGNGRRPGPAAPSVAPERALPARQQDWPTDRVPRWEPPDGPAGPLPAPGPAPVPEAVREAVATPFGDEREPPLPGAQVDPDTGVARIDSRRTSKYVSAPPPRPTFRGDVTRAAPAPAPAPRRPRRTEPLRGR